MRGVFIIGTFCATLFLTAGCVTAKNCTTAGSNNDVNIPRAIPKWPIVGEHVEVCPGWEWQTRIGEVVKTDPEYVTVRFQMNNRWQGWDVDIVFKRYQLTRITKFECQS